MPHKINDLTGFLPTPSHGGRLDHSLSAPSVQLFLPTPSHGGRPRTKAGQRMGRQISTHALTWRATAHNPVFCPQFGDFYPRPHMEGDSEGIDFSPFLTISTHALTWRATTPFVKVRKLQQNFYPRPHMEGDSA